jgi:AAA domain
MTHCPSGRLRRKASLGPNCSVVSDAIDMAGEEFQADVALVDVGPNLGPLNRAALLACDFVVVPLGADLLSLQGLRNMGPTLRGWRDAWHDRRTKTPDRSIVLPEGQMHPVGYIVMRHCGVHRHASFRDCRKAGPRIRTMDRTHARPVSGVCSG